MLSAGGGGCMSAWAPGPVPRRGGHCGQLPPRPPSPSPRGGCLQTARERGRILALSRAIAKARTAGQEGCCGAASSGGTSQALVPASTALPCGCGWKGPCLNPNPAGLLQSGLGSDAAASQCLPSCSSPPLLPPMPPAWDVTVRGESGFCPFPGQLRQSLRFWCPQPAPVRVLQLERHSGRDARARGDFPAMQGMPEIFLQAAE